MFNIFVFLGLSINTTTVKEHHKEVEDVTHNIDEDITIGKLTGRGLHNDEAFFQANDVKGTVEKSAYDSSEKDDIQDRNEITESLFKTIYSSQDNKEEEDDEEDNEEEADEEGEEEEKSDHINNLLELEIKAQLNILISLSDDNQII